MSITYIFFSENYVTITFYMNTTHCEKDIHKLYLKPVKTIIIAM